jgi:hypothetical protein
MKAQDQNSRRLRDLCNWPPLWVRLGKLPSTAGKSFAGEIGILKEVRHYQDRRGRLYLTMVHGHATYVTCLLFKNQALCNQAFERLRRCYGMTMESVGSLELEL